MNTIRIALGSLIAACLLAISPSANASHTGCPNYNTITPSELSQLYYGMPMSYALRTTGTSYGFVQQGNTATAIYKVCNTSPQKYQNITFTNNGNGFFLTAISGEY